MSNKSRTRKKGRGTVIDKWKTKEWYEVFAPKTFGEEYIGAIPSSTPDSLQGRVIETLLYDLTNNFKHTHIKLKFKVTQVVGNRCNTRFWGHELTRDYIRSKIHRGSTRIDGIFNFTTADGFVYRVSTFVVTKRRAKKSQQKTIRKIIFQVLNEFAQNMTHDKFVRGIVFGKFSDNIWKIAKTIYPLTECQVRKVKVITMPEDVEDQMFTTFDDEVEEVGVNLPEHGKQVKAKKGKRKKELEKEEGEEAEGEESEEEKSEEENPEAESSETEEKTE